MATVIKGKNPKRPHTVRYQLQGHQHTARCKPGCAKTITQKERSFATAGEARDFRIKFEHDSRESVFVDSKLGRIPFMQAAEQWIARLAGAPGTREGYRSILNAHIKDSPLGSMSLAAVAQSREAVQDLLLVTMPATVGASRISMARTLIVSTVTEAVRAGRIPASHKLSDIPVAAPGHKPETFIMATYAQLRTIADGLRPDLALSVWLQRGAGLRVSESLAVNLAGFRDGGRTLRVSEQVTTSGDATAALKHRHVGEYRDVPCPAWLWSKVEDHVRDHGTSADGYLFRGIRNKKFPAYRSYLQVFVHHAGLAGLPAGFGPHQNRHAFATDTLTNGTAVQIHELASWLGHRDVNVTIGTYGHLLPDAFGRGRAALDSAFAKWSQAE